jgi:hypothetical protein
MVKKNSRRHQKLYKMKGCSKTRKCHLGGNVSDLNLAYPSNNIQTVPNPFLAYTGKGGATPQNVNGINPAYPNTGPPSGGFNFLNPQGNQHGGCGGTCGGTCGLMKGGTSCSTCSLMKGGKKSHRVSCKCTHCKKGGMKGKMRGGMSNHGMSNHGIPYPNGLVGSPYSNSVGGLPGTNGIGGDRNYYPVNTYYPDISRQMLDIGANPPFNGMKGGMKGGTKRRKQRGGTLSNFLGQDLINLGRQFQFGLGSAYNALAGYPSPANPLPWKGQLPNTASLSSVKATYI